MEYARWAELNDRIYEEIGKRAFAGRGICIFTKKQKTVVFSGQDIDVAVTKKQTAIVLRSVESVPYYDDEFDEDYETCLYTLEGKNGDQDMHSVANMSLVCGSSKIFIYRALGNGHYIWLGEYVRDPSTPIQMSNHPGEDGAMRKIYRIPLIKKYIL